MPENSLCNFALTCFDSSLTADFGGTTGRTTTLAVGFAAVGETGAAFADTGADFLSEVSPKPLVSISSALAFAIAFSISASSAEVKPGIGSAVGGTTALAATPALIFLSFSISLSSSFALS